MTQESLVAQSREQATKHEKGTKRALIPQKIGVEMWHTALNYRITAPHSLKVSIFENLMRIVLTGRSKVPLRVRLLRSNAPFATHGLTLPSRSLRFFALPLYLREQSFSLFSYPFSSRGHSFSCFSKQSSNSTTMAVAGPIPSIVGALSCQKDSYLRTLQTEVVSCTEYTPALTSGKPKGKKSKGSVEGAENVTSAAEKTWLIEMADSVLFPEGMSL